MKQLPNPLTVGPGEAGKIAKWCNQVLEYVKSRTPIMGPNGLVEHHPNGTIRKPRPGEGGSSTGATTARWL